jgi:hypothetical protein
MKWCIETEFDGIKKLFTGNGWEVQASDAKVYEDPGKAQQDCDAFHLASCTFNHQFVRETIPKFIVVDIEDGVEYSPKPLIANKRFYMREKI